MLALSAVGWKVPTCLARPQTDTTPTGPLMPLSTCNASGEISNLPLSVSCLTSSRGVPGLTGKCADGASAGFCFLALPKKKDILSACVLLAQRWCLL